MHLLPQPLRQQRQEQPQTAAPVIIDFNDTRTSYSCFTTPQLLRAWLVLRVCGWRPLVANAERLLRLGYRVFGHTVVDAVIRQTFFKHFCAGETAGEVGARVRQLQALGVNGIFDYAAEAEVAAEETPPASTSSAAASTSGARTVVARQYSYDGEALCDARAGVFLECIRAVRDQSPGGIAAIKMTALSDPLLLTRASACIVELKRLFHRLDEGATGKITPEQFEQGYRRLFRCETAADRAQFEDLVEQLAVGGVRARTDCIDYVDWSNRIDIEDLARISNACREEGPFFRAALALDADALQLLRNMRRRVGALADAARDCGVRFMIDAEQVRDCGVRLMIDAEQAHDCGLRLMINAEQTVTQPVIDNLVCSLQREYNVMDDARAPTIYGTYQCYLKDTPQRLADDLERARRGNYAFACKLVRGAYMEAERARAAAAHTPSPVCDTLDATHANYTRATDLVLAHMGAGHRAEVMFATHNQASVERALAAMAALSVERGVAFGQLLGMSDHLTFALGARGYAAFKYLPYGRVAEVVPYLLRRARENSALLGGATHERALLLREVRRRMLG
ncbi:FAD-linked oxidoreductase-like protein [Tribonema minus]|uniref:Proline dehydrogenase n=1 Tax=Tribonema minus TaxID=303371 RepID=A0A835Z648_9STRA|nr:FAD-linked oxidoreductase-like protein [Tribonema minus]